MQEDSDGRAPETGNRPDQGKSESRPQQAGEAETTRFGMEDGDNTETPATGDGTRDNEAAERAR